MQVAFEENKESVAQSVADELDRARRDYEKHIEVDPQVRKKDTVQMVIHILNRIKGASEMLNR